MSLLLQAACETPKPQTICLTPLFKLTFPTMLMCVCRHTAASHTHVNKTSTHPWFDCKTVKKLSESGICCLQSLLRRFIFRTLSSFIREPTMYWSFNLDGLAVCGFSQLEVRQSDRQWLHVSLCWSYELISVGTHGQILSRIWSQYNKNWSIHRVKLKLFVSICLKFTWTF